MLHLTTLLGELPPERTRLLDNLGRLRREVGPITPELSDALADQMNLRRGDVHEVVWSTRSCRCRWTRRVCTGPVCDCFGARDLLAEGAIEVPASATATSRRWLCSATRSSAASPTDERLPARAGRDARAGRADAGRGARELEASGLTGMGGAGFPTWRKWDAVRREPGPRVVVVNADEGEPGTIKDRYVMELRPQLLLEGLAAAMRFCETDEAYIYLREEYATARAVLQEAIAARGLAVELVIGAGAYICGEETAMLESMEGRRGMPRLRPPFPAQFGYLGRPTLINNVETLAHVARSCAAAGSRRGSGRCPARSRKPGCYEAPLDVTLRELIDDYAGGVTDEIGAIVPGGAASGILPPAALDVPLTREALAEWGAAPAPRPAGLPELATPCSACSPRRCASSPRSRARSARRAGSATARSTTSVEGLEHGARRCPRARSTSGSTRWRGPRSAASARARRSRCGTLRSTGRSSSRR